MLRQTPNRRHRWLAPANSGLESSYESRPGYHPVEVHTQAGPTQVSLHNQAVEALGDFCLTPQKDAMGPAARTSLACIIHVVEGAKSLLCYKHVVKTVFGATKEASA